MWVGGQCQARTALPPGMTLYPSYRRLGWPQGRSGRVRKSRPNGIRSPDRPARSKSLYRLSYRGPHENTSNKINFIYIYIYEYYSREEENGKEMGCTREALRLEEYTGF